MDLPDEQLPHLGTFSKAAELSGFTAAAKALGLTQAAVSQRIQTLEKSLDTSLFDRRGGRVLLTDAGRTLYAYAQRIADLHHEARREVTGRDAPVAGELVIAASSVPGEHLLPALLAAFGHQHPHVRVRAGVGDSVAVMAQVERGEVGVGLVGRKSNDPNLVFRFLAADHMVLVTPPGHALGRKKKVTVDQLAAHPLIVREAGSGSRHCFEKSLERAGRSMTELRVALELGSNEAIKGAVLRGVGVAVLSNLALQKEIKAGTLHVLEVEDIRCDREMFVVRDRRRVPSLPTRLFLNFLEANPAPHLNP
ncbi:selenium metabolism-associated LysR family transcriptional regulator [Gemmata sp.]|uniref:selenium metabolism-associated LysR family transcriptional regulator n=1 Tax=Gemmata sp. TaxID=1914242 RepID=UPI003F6F46EC